MKRVHPMPFGAEVLPSGHVRFRLWAPEARTVALVIGDGPEVRKVSMQRKSEGWFHRETADAEAGTLYRFEVDEKMLVPDPASRFNPLGVHGPSEVCDPFEFSWTDGTWAGRPWNEAVIYELHVGAFSPEHSYAGIEQRLDYLAQLGVTVLELMPLADFPGDRNWGYDGVLQYAPAHPYGRPEDLKRLVQSAHHHGLMVMLDVVYNHFGPDGNYLSMYAPAFFSRRHQTPWGDAINFDDPESRTVRDFFIHNALYWLEEFHLDGLRFDSVQTIHDEGPQHFLEELATTVREGPGASRPIHLVLENDQNESSRLARKPRETYRFTAQWNDDFHHCAHVLLTGESDGYYADYADDPILMLGRCLSEGFAYQGQPSGFRNGAPRGEPSAGWPTSAFVNSLQNHDQVGNRAIGERLGMLVDHEALRMATAILLLAPFPPLLFMGQEFAADTPFLFFCDFGGELADDVREGRRKEFAKFTSFLRPEARELIPDPNAPETFARSCLDWNALESVSHLGWFTLHQHLLNLRRHEIVPRLEGSSNLRPSLSRIGSTGLTCTWHLNDGSRLTLVANAGPHPVQGFSEPPGSRLFGTPASTDREPFMGELPAWAALWNLERAGVTP